MTRRPAITLALALVLTAGTMSAHAQPAPLVILTPTGDTRDGLPVLTRHPQPERTLDVLLRGFSGRVLRLYAMEQEFLRRRAGTAPEPAYLLLSDRQGGFPQFGFYLDGEKKADVGWVDLHRSSDLSGRFGAMDGIFPHELLHVIVHQLAGPMPEGGANQVHAIGVRTDPQVAFNEGFAEHAQIMAIDDEDAPADTRPLAEDRGRLDWAESNLEAYQRDLQSRSPFPASRMRFLLWYNKTEQTLRYHAIKANRFSRQPSVPPALLARPDLYDAYLFLSVMPGAPGAGDPVPTRVRLARESVVAYLFWRIATSPGLRAAYREEAFYASFGTTREGVSPLENVYLKLFAAMYAGRPTTTAGLVDAYRRLFPDEAAVVDALTADALGAGPADAPELWLANPSFVTGTTLFDQFRALPRVHTFDVNAATAFDWLTVPGVSADAARALADGAPYARLEDVEAIAGPALAARIQQMSKAMRDLRGRGRNEEETLSLWTIVSAYLWRLTVMMLIAIAGGAFLARRAGVRRWLTAALIAIAATTMAIFFGWMVVGPWWLAVAAPPIVGGLPWALWRAARRRDLAAAFVGPAAWAAATVPALLLMNLSRWI